MARKTSLVGKALKSLKAAVTESQPKNQPSGASEKIVAIPEVAVFSELPFSHVGMIGGTGVNIITSPSATPRKAAKKAASKTKPMSSKSVGTTERVAKKTTKKTTKNGAVKTHSKRKKAR